MAIPVVITAYADRSFSFVTKTPPASYFLKKAAGVEKGSQTPSKGFVGKVTMNQVREIAEKKMKDLNAKDLEGAARMIAGSARSMGLEVVEESHGDRKALQEGERGSQSRDLLSAGRGREAGEVAF